jgi:hypothetical protein
MIKIRCKTCNKELEGHPVRTRCCGCTNMTTITNDKISALDLSQVIMLSYESPKQKSNALTNNDLDFQEQRKKRKINRSLLDSIDIR